MSSNYAYRDERREEKEKVKEKKNGKETRTCERNNSICVCVCVERETERERDDQNARVVLDHVDSYRNNPHRKNPPFRRCKFHCTRSNVIAIFERIEVYRDVLRMALAVEKLVQSIARWNLH